jgi:hypothetical protein
MEDPKNEKIQFELGSINALECIYTKSETIIPIICDKDKLLWQCLRVGNDANKAEPIILHTDELMKIKYI